MCPITHASFLALGLSVVASFIFGYLWYGPLFGKTWGRLMGFKITEECQGAPPVSALLLTLLGTFFSTFAMAYLLHKTTMVCNFGLAFLAWLGFCTPLLFSQVAWERKPWKLFAINAAFYFLNLQLIAAILTYIH